MSHLADILKGKTKIKNIQPKQAADLIESISKLHWNYKEDDDTVWEPYFVGCRYSGRTLEVFPGSKTAKMIEEGSMVEQQIEDKTALMLYRRLQLEKGKSSWTVPAEEVKKELSIGKSENTDSALDNAVRQLSVFIENLSMQKKMEGGKVSKYIFRFPKKSSAGRNTAEIKEVIEYLNSVTGKNYKPDTDTYGQLIRGRLREGYTVNDFFTVIDNKLDEWGENPDMRKFLRPQTLFAKGHFDDYLQQGMDENPSW